jgi:integration host factor subunit alpha
LSVTRKDLAKNISKKLGLSQKDSLFFVQEFFKVLADYKSTNININKFGTFLYKKTPKRVGRNPKTLQEYEIRPRQKLTFKPSEEVKQNIN